MTSLLAAHPLTLGTMYFGTTVPARIAHDVLDRARDLGALSWDTANIYAHWVGRDGGESERTLGAWFDSRGPIARDEVTLATKIGNLPVAGGPGPGGTTGLGASAVRRQVTDSLQRLRTDRVEVLYAHIDDLHTPLDETLGALSDLIDEGLVREIAASNYSAERLHAALSVPTAHRFTALQQRFTYLRPAPGADLSPHVQLDDAVAHLAHRSGLTLVGYSPLLSGAYTRADRPIPEQYRTPALGPALLALGEVGSEVDLDAGQTVLAWMTQRGRPVRPVAGVSSVGQIEDAWRAVTTELDPDQIDRLDRARIVGPAAR
ncbi:aldo/keto reductase [Georgenia sp. Z1491]|uniref:aldo/keto reductase n=1 Tax=Georgenia sp. Z1491 TaxID=3416707 RepID=UPI003CFAA378